MLYSTRYKKAHYRHSPVVSTHSTLDKYFYLAQSAIISPPSFLSLVFDRYFSISFRDKQGSNTARRTSASIPTILSCGPLSYRACVCVLIDACVQLLLYKRSAQNYTTTQSKQIFYQTSCPANSTALIRLRRFKRLSVV